MKEEKPCEPEKYKLTKLGKEVIEIGSLNARKPKMKEETCERCGSVLVRVVPPNLKVCPVCLKKQLNADLKDFMETKKIQQIIDRNVDETGVG